MKSTRSKPPASPKRKKTAPKTVTKSARRQKTASLAVFSKSDLAYIGKVFTDLVAVQARLRAPGGCPWDREQSHATLRTCLIEESYEALDAIESGSSENLAEELGDLMLQVLFHADMAREAKTFTLPDVITGIRDKMIRRHPHVFGNVKADTSSEVLKNWALIKAKEKQGLQRNLSAQNPSALDGIPRSLPALMEAFQISRRAARVGFDWDELDGVFDKLREEIAELQNALSPLNREAVEEELGDLLFTVVNLSRFLSLDPEVILKKSNKKFKQRFMAMETQALNVKVSFSKLSKEKLEELWQSAKIKVQPHVSSESKA